MPWKGIVIQTKLATQREAPIAFTTAEASPTLRVGEACALRLRRSSNLGFASYAMTIGHFFTWNTPKPEVLEFHYICVGKAPG
ncbi:hypothetical protein [Calothrix sp. PCC 6303]|uniref:hypothetical protein n=1 Tax=Calothrix sp. PCC 6303 TaxID=1170562 RepID=UPI0002A02651|nr:hypothetical protein [Calothrix sp. PCC 6303]AFZ02988.1 hypothetical protein Cal6303_4072 [Calothrix sp. PCC 6303]